MENNTKFIKGHRKIGGRRKGTPNKKTSEIIERLKDEDIVGSLLEIANTTEKEEIKLKVYIELMKYVYPQRKAVDLNAADNDYTIYINHEFVEVERD